MTHTPQDGGPVMIPNYNDGNWHGWSGGECPVHLESVVEVRLMRRFDEHGDMTRPASNWEWDHIGDGDIIAFRVITPYAEPAPEPVKPAKRDLRTINEPFGELDERTQKRLRKAAKRGLPVQSSGGSGIWLSCTPNWLMGLKYRLDPTFTPPEKRATFWLTNGVPEMTWQPIEIAPKDGTPHVRGLFVTNNRTRERWWEPICGRIDDYGEFIDHDGNAPWRADDYTHWMPLPEPPL